jgi:hypothetical protein
MCALYTKTPPHRDKGNANLNKSRTSCCALTKTTPPFAYILTRSGCDSPSSIWGSRSTRCLFARVDKILRNDRLNVEKQHQRRSSCASKAFPRTVQAHKHGEQSAQPKTTTKQTKQVSSLQTFSQHLPMERASHFYKIKDFFYFLVFFLFCCFSSRNKIG